MAHIGREFPLLFRRDLCLNCVNYRQGIPLKFRTTGIVTFGTFTGYDINLDGVILSTTTEPESATPEWESDEVTQEGRTFILRVTFNGWDIPNGRTLFRARILSDGDEVLEWRTIDGPIGRCSFVETRNNAPFTWAEDTSYWGHLVTANSVVFEPCPWSEVS